MMNIENILEKLVSLAVPMAETPGSDRKNKKGYRSVDGWWHCPYPSRMAASFSAHEKTVKSLLIECISWDTL